MLQTYRRDLDQGQKPVKLASTLIGVEFRGFDKSSDDKASRAEILADLDRLNKYYPYLSNYLVQDLMVFMFYLIHQTYHNDDLQLTIGVTRLESGNGMYKGTRFQIDSAKYRQALILDFFDLTVVRVIDKYWLYSTLFPAKEDDPKVAQPMIDYLGLDQFLDEKFEPEIHNFSFQTLYVHRQPIGAHIKPLGYVQKHHKVFRFLHDMISQLKHYGVHIIIKLTPLGKVVEFHHVGVPNTEDYEAKGALILHLVKSRIVEEGWEELDESVREELTELYQCTIFD